MMTKQLMWAWVSCAAAAAAAGADVSWRVEKNAALTAAIDQIGSPYVEGKTPGMIVAVLKRGDVIFLKGYGDANLEFHIPWDPTVVYTFYSTTKSMGAAAIFELQRQGRLRIADSMYAHLPDFPRFAQDITVAQLLNHTSGLWEDEAAVYYAGTTIGDNVLTLDELYALNKRQRVMPYRPGTNMFYSDTGNRLAARIIERVTGKSFGEAMQDLVFRPAGMSTAAIKNRESTRYPRQATTYFMTRVLPPPAFEVPNTSVETSGDGGGNGSILDFIAYARFLSQEVSPGIRRVDELTQPVALRGNFDSAYRYGLIQQRHRGLDVARHGGLWGKLIIYVPKLDVWILTMRNFIDDRPNNGDLEPLLDAVIAADPDARAFRSDRNPLWQETLSAPKPMKLSPAELRAFSGRYLEPASGLMLRFTADAGAGRIGYSMFEGESEYAQYVVRSPDASARRRTADRRLSRPTEYRSFGYGPNPVNLRLSGDSLAVQFADWPEPRPLTVVRADVPRAPLDIDGIYFSADLGVYYTVRTHGGQAELFIGSGNRQADYYALRRDTDFIFSGGPQAGSSYLSLPLSLRFEAKDGVATGFDLLTPNVQGVTFRKLGV
jgi:CubicO group peptidase (beta-lactamase class C family)